MKKYFGLLAIQFLIAANCMAAVVTVNYQSTNAGYSSLSGSFTGNDANNDGVLSLSELSNWNTNYDGAVFSALNDIGDFNYVSNIWTPNARQWDQVTEDAYMTWNNWSFSASTSNYAWTWLVTTDFQQNQVPEPAPIALLGLALSGLVILRRRKAA